MKRWAWLPVPVLLAAIIALHVADWRTVYESEALLVALNFIFSTLASLLIVILVARSFAARPAPGLLLVGCGVIFWGSAGTVAPLLLSHGQNVVISVHNILLGLAAICHLAGAAVSRTQSPPGAASVAGQRERRELRRDSARYTGLAATCAAALAVVWLVAVAVLNGWLPVFFVQGQGGTTIRQVELTATLLLFAGAAVLLWLKNRDALTPFVRWYSLTLALTATGVLGILLQSAAGTPLGWTGRAAFLLGGAYMFLAALAALRESGGHVTLAAQLRASEERYRHLFDSMTEGFALHEIITDAQGRPVDYRFLELNPAWERLTGIQRNSAIGKRVLEVIPNLEPAWIERFGQVALTGEPAHFENYVAALHRWYEVSASRNAPGQFAVMFIDITARKQVEQSQERLIALMDHNPSLIFLKDEQGRYIYLNRAYEERFAIAKDWQGRTDLDLWPKESAELFRKHDAEVLKSGAIQQLLEDSVDWAGNRRCWLCYKFPYTASNGQRYLGGIGIDATARVLAEEALERTRHTLAEGQRIAHLGSWEYVAATQTTVWSDEEKRIFGLDPAQPSPDYETMLRQCIHPDDAARVDQQFRAALANGESFENEQRIVRPDGTIRWVYNKAQPYFDEHGQLLRYVGTTLDITERKQAEAAAAAAHLQLQSVIDGTTSLIYACDLEARFLFVNAALAALLKTTPEQMRGKRRHEFMPREDADKHEANDRDVMAAGRAVEFEEHSELPGRSITWLSTKFPLRDAQGRIYAVAGIVTDITARKRAEEELRAAKLSAEQARAIAESASKAKDQFIAVLSHELRTPLTPAVAALSLLRRDVRLPHDVREVLEIVSNNIDLEVRLIADLLDVSRIISGKLHLERRPIDVADALRGAARIVSGDLDAKGQSLGIETPGAPYLTFADPARLQQVFWNLLRNSIKFSPAGSRIMVRAQVVPTDQCPLASQPCCVGKGECPLPAANGNDQPCGRNLVVEIIDQGSGIDPEVLPRLFNVFEQERKARSFGGLGLGLSICRAVVEAHGGSISAQSEGIGCGATFTVYLPVAQCPLAEGVGQPTRAQPPDAEVPGTSGRRSLRILLVEDHADTARLMRRLLMAEGHDVVTAGCVSEGLAAARQQQPDVLISDLGLPDGTGMDLMHELRARNHRIPAIALSGYGSAADIEKSEAAGFAEHLTKPLASVDVLLAAIARLGLRGQQTGAQT